MGMIIMNGKEYTSSPKDGFPPIVYSDEEREIGVWRDGKPLYQKSFEIQPSDSSNQVEILHNISNIEKCVKYEGCLNYISGTDNRFLPQIYYNNLDVYSASIYTVNATKIRLVYGEWLKGQASVFKCYVTIYYTKTTDTPGSGKYTTYGGLSHHYSTTEQVVGTWIDGKPLYERVFDLGSAVTISSNWTKVINDTNIIPIQCIGIYDTNVASYPLTADSDNDGLYLKGDDVSINKFILQYTKTTD